MKSFGMSLTGMRMYSNLSNCVARYIFFISMVMYLAPGVLKTLFHIILVVIRSAVRVVSSSGYVIKLPPAVMRIRFGSSFCGW